MFDLTYLNDDEQLARLSREYWLRDTDGEWIFTITQLAKKHEINVSKVSSVVRKTCIAQSTEITCSECHKPMEIGSRTEYESLVPKGNLKSKLGTRRKISCQACIDEDLRKRLQEREDKKERERLAIIHWVEKQIAQFQPKNYAAASTREAFLLYGLLSSAGAAWETNHLAAWETYYPKLFAHIHDTHQIYTELQNTGWMIPSTSSKRAAFDVYEESSIAFYPTHVDWTLAADSGETTFLDLLPLLHEKLSDVPIEDLRSLWYSVCLSELRAYFEEVHERFSFDSKGWTPLVEQNMRLLLRECSLAEAKGIVWFGLKNLVTAREDKNNKSYIVKNWIPGTFMRTLERHRAYGPLKQWDRPVIEKEAVCTSLLFDKVLSARTNPYGTLRGSDLE